MNIILTDDHKMFVDGISFLLGKKGWNVTGMASNGEDLFRIIKTGAVPDVVVLDIEMPGMDGVESARKLKKQYPEVKVLVLSMHDENEFIRQMLETGIDGYILKDEGREELIKALDTIQSNQKYFGQKITENIVKVYSGSQSESVKLTRREIEIIRLIADQKTTTQIAKMLFLSKHTVETHRKNILLKLNVKNTAGLIKYAMKNGIIT
jgi:DNA-binding NarL/FixJ family response regulator